MKETIKELLKSTIISICTATLIFCLVGVVFDLRYGGNFTLSDHRFTKMVLGCIGIGLGFGVPSLIYRNEALPMPVRTLIHLGVGSTVYVLIAYLVGWLGDTASFSQGLLIGAIQLSVIVIIWLIFFSHYKNEARQLNERIQQMKTK